MKPFNPDAALNAATAKLTAEDRAAIIRAFVRLLMASAYAVQVTSSEEKNETAVQRSVSAMAAFSNPELIYGTAFSLAGPLGCSGDESTVVTDAVQELAQELKAASPREAKALLSRVLRQAASNFLS